MDISVYIAELLYEHDCVIVTGFGGFICNYKPAYIHPVLHTVSPPSKAISFNRHLRSNDGLLMSLIAERNGVSFNEASEMIQGWVNSSAAMLKKGEQIILPKIGKFQNDIERNLQFEPDTNINYLKQSFGLRTIIAEPILRGQGISFTEKFRDETKHVLVERKIWRMAAAVFLVAALTVLAQLMFSGVQIQQLNLDEASVFNCVNHVFKAQEPEMKLLPVELNSTAPLVVDSTNASNADLIDSAITATISVISQQPAVVQSTIPAQEEKTLPVASSSEHNYYIIVGAFAEDKNVEAAKQRVHEKFPNAEILIERKNGLTKLGYLAGSNYTSAKEQLKKAQQDDASFWLMKK